MVSDNNRDRKYRIFLSAAESSGDRLCEKLIIALRQNSSRIEFVGLGGDRMAAAGCEIIEKTTQRAAMHYKAIMEVLFFLKVIRRTKEYFKNNRPDFVIVCDSPAFNFHIARIAAKSGIKTMFYVAPQLWAWAPWRVKKLKRLCTAGLAGLLPFEPEWFGNRGIECRFIGNPLLEDVDPTDITPKTYSDFSIASAHIALMPGSRPAEIKTLWPAMQQIARTLKARHPGIKFTAVAAEEGVLAAMKKNELKILRCDYTTDAVSDTAKKVDFSIVTSGSATLQVASAACPMVVIYQSNRFLWQSIGKRLVTIENLSLVNILAGRRLVPEFMPCFASTAPIIQACERLLNDTAEMKKLSSELTGLLKPLASIKASQNAAEMVTEQLAKIC